MYIKVFVKEDWIFKKFTTKLENSFKVGNNNPNLIISSRFCREHLDSSKNFSVLLDEWHSVLKWWNCWNFFFLLFFLLISICDVSLFDGLRLRLLQHNSFVLNFWVKCVSQEKLRLRFLGIAPRCQFHQRFKYKFFVQTLFQQLFLVACT